jgi:peptidoglycan-N-acetylglucosamine deacetylase
VTAGLTLLTGCAPDPAEPVASPAHPRQTPPAPAASATRNPPSRPAAAPLARRKLVGTEPKAAKRRARAERRADDDRPMFYVEDGPKAIALTIDDGPSPIYTPQILLLLEKYRVTATFCMIGIEVDAYRGVAREVAAAGHIIANHTWTHPDLAVLPSIAVADQMSRATAAIHKVTGRVPTLFRAPYGAWSPPVLQHCAQTGMTPLDWSVDPRDWSRPGVTSIVSNILDNTRTGSIILEHDGGGDRSQTVAAMKIVLPRLLAAGYHFRTP